LLGRLLLQVQSKVAPAAFVVVRGRCQPPS
jgi:hypothetical protein